MKPILVPGPPKSAFNKHRRMSDLIKKQVEHFKHLEHKLPPEVRAELPQHAIITEDDAARYIGPVTKFFLTREAAKPARKQSSKNATQSKPKDPSVTVKVSGSKSSRKDAPSTGKKKK